MGLQPLIMCMMVTYYYYSIKVAKIVIDTIIEKWKKCSVYQTCSINELFTSLYMWRLYRDALGVGRGRLTLPHGNTYIRSVELRAEFIGQQDTRS